MNFKRVKFVMFYLTVVTCGSFSANSLADVNQQATVSVDYIDYEEGYELFEESSEFEESETKFAAGVYRLCIRYYGMYSTFFCPTPRYDARKCIYSHLGCR